MVKSTKSLESVAYRKLKELVVSASYLPGDLVSENELSAELGISRTPIHAAVVRLEKEGFLESLPKRGAIVKDISFSEFFGMHETIVAMEMYALERAGVDGRTFDLGRLKAELDAQEAALREGDYLSYYVRGVDFAAAILQSVNNAAMLSVLESFRDRIVFKIVSFRKTRPGKKPHLTMRTNKKLYGAILAGDLKAARAELDDNLSTLYRTLMIERQI